MRRREFIAVLRRRCGCGLSRHHGQQDGHKGDRRSWIWIARRSARQLSPRPNVAWPKSAMSRAENLVIEYRGADSQEKRLKPS